LLFFYILIFGRYAEYAQISVFFFALSFRLILPFDHISLARECGVYGSSLDLSPAPRSRKRNKIRDIAV
jgi:hypothetical protein